MFSLTILTVCLATILWGLKIPCSAFLLWAFSCLVTALFWFLHYYFFPALHSKFVDSHFIFWKEDSLDTNSPQLQFSSRGYKHKGTVIPRIRIASLKKTFLLIQEGREKRRNMKYTESEIKIQSTCYLI